MATDSNLVVWTKKNPTGTSGAAARSASVLVAGRTRPASIWLRAAAEMGRGMRVTTCCWVSALSSRAIRTRCGCASSPSTRPS